jgi:hypothetical protein
VNGVLQFDEFYTCTGKREKGKGKKGKAGRFLFLTFGLGLNFLRFTLRVPLNRYDVRKHALY